MGLHQQVAVAMENAYHSSLQLNNAGWPIWGMAQDAAKEAHYAALAGDRRCIPALIQVAQTFLKRRAGIVG